MRWKLRVGIREHLQLYTIGESKYCSSFYKIKMSRYIYVVIVEYVIVIHAAHTQKAKTK